MKTVLLTLLVSALVGAAGAGTVVYFGLYDVTATDQHLRPTYHLLKIALERSVARRAAEVEVPPLGAPEQVERGAALFRRHCVQCHGAPGVAPEPFALGLTPLATPLARSGRERGPAFLFWVVKHGVKMTGMPAWQYRMSDAEIWSLVAFMQRLPELSPAAYKALPDKAPPPRDEESGEPVNLDRGRRALEQYACVSCHEIPGLVGPEARLGPTLHGIGERGMLAGILPNSPENLAAWIRTPQAFAPGSAMPNLGVTERDARDMVAYLRTLK